MGNSVIMQLLHPFAYLEYALESIFFGHFVILGSVKSIPERSPLAELSDVPYWGGRLDDVVNLEDILILHFFEFFVDDFLFFDIFTFALIPINLADG